MERKAGLICGSRDRSAASFATARDILNCASQGCNNRLALSEILDVDSRDEAQVGLLALGVPSNESGPSGSVGVV
jgi:hypothetical protein